MPVDAPLTPLQKAVLALKSMRRRLDELEGERRAPIAVVGIGCRFPGGGDDPDAFFQSLLDGVDACGEVPPDRWDAAALYDPDPEAPGKTYVRRGCFLAGVDRFDPGFFGITPREAAAIDPQHRLLLEIAWEALEDAGVAPHTLREVATGVFVGIGIDDYAKRQLRWGDPTLIDAYTGSGNGLCFASGRLSYVLGTHGPSLSVDTACSSSLVALHLACQSLRNGECRLALAGGVNLMLSPESTLFLCKARALSPDGRCKAFDAAADGYGRGEGCAVVALKRLADAERDGDDVLAVVRGSAMNHDGRSGGLTVPNGEAQQAVIRAGLANAGVTADELDYVEAHGTGTVLGDPIELRALAAVIGERNGRRLRVGSVKTNVGHLETAAGVASLVKVVMALRRGWLPASLHLREPNPYVAWGELPLEVVREATPWPAGERPRRAGINGFGLSGTNVHVVVEEAPRRSAAPTGSGQPGAGRQTVSSVVPSVSEGSGGLGGGKPARDRPLHLITLTARSENSLRVLASRFAEHLASHPEIALADVCFTANTGRSPMPERLVTTAASATELQEALAAFARGEEAPVETGRVPAQPPRVAFLFTGQGAAWTGMGRQLYATHPGFRDTIDRCAEILGPHLPVPLPELLFDPASAPLLAETANAQPALFALQVALAELWRSWGVEPFAVLGHGAGELAAACVAGVFDVRDGLKLAAASAAAHGVTFTEPKLPLVAGATGAIARGEVAAAEYWVEQARRPVRFADGVATLAARGCTAFVEIGPRPVLLALARRGLPRVEGVWLPSLRPGRDDWQQVLSSLGRLALAGVAVDWTGFDRGYARRRRHLPTSPYERRRCWIDEPERGAGAAPAVGEEFLGREEEALPVATAAGDSAPAPAMAEQRAARHSASDAAGDVASWLYELVWRPAPRREEEVEAAPRRLLVLGATRGHAAAVAACLIQCAAEYGAEVLLAEPGSHFDNPAPGRYIVDPAAPADLDRLLREAAGARGLDAVVHLWSLGGEASAPDLESTFQLIQSVLRSGASPRLWMVTAGGQAVGSGDELRPAQAGLWGLGRTLQIEHPGLRPALVDLDPGEPDLDGLVAEILGPAREDQIAFRGGARHVARLVRASLAASVESTRTVSPSATWRAVRVSASAAADAPEAESCRDLPVRADRTYLISGGRGAIGLRLATWLVDRGARHLILVGRGEPSDEAVTTTAALERRGARVRLAAADVGDPDDVARVVGLCASPLAQDIAPDALPPLAGIFHAAAVLDDGVLAQQDWSRFERVLRPKALGAFHLHEATLELPLDVFVCFSSIASLLGSAGQASYAAASAGLDLLAHHRRALGLPALTVNWGPWSIGMAARTGARERERLRAQGLDFLDPDGALAALGELLRRDATQAAVLPMDWQVFTRALPGDPPPVLRELVAPHAPSTVSWRARLTAAAPPQRAELAGELVRSLVAKVAGLGAGERIAARQSLLELGLDSLMALELRNRLESALAVALPSTLLFDHPTPERLVAFLLGALGLASPPAPDAAVDETDDAALCAEVPDEEVARLLRAELSLGEERGR